MSKSDKFYFENFMQCTTYSKQAADYLVHCLENFVPENIDDMLVKMHEIEHGADIIRHQMNDALAKAFVTPIDREDLDLLSHELDSVTDGIEDILLRLYINNISEIEPFAIKFAKKIVESCECLCDIMAEFENFKKSKKIHELIVKLNDVEEECDRLYLKAARQLMKEPKDVLTALSWREIFDCFESCADACEEVSESIASVIMKNT